MFKRKTILTGVLLLFFAAALFAGCEPSVQEQASSAPEQSEDLLDVTSSTAVGSSADSVAEKSAVIELPPDESSEASSFAESSDEEESLDTESSADESSAEASSEASSDPSGGYRTATVTYEVPSRGETYTRLPSLEQLTFVVPDADNGRGLDTQKRDFGFGVATGGVAHPTSVDNQKRFDGYGTNALAWDNKTEEKVVYLTFDCGYKYEDLVERILDTLQEKDVPAAFFCTLPYLKEAPDDVVRMINEGHIVGNHSVNHPSDSAALSREELAKELLGVENYLRECFGYTSKYFRFPGGVHSENAIDLVDSVGCRSVFWSLAHTDWDPENQPGVEKSFETVTGRLHAGAVILLHSTSPDNADILADFIDYCRAQGYTFRSLDEYAFWAE